MLEYAFKTEPAVKVVTLGKSGVGKTALINKIITGKFLVHTEATIGCVFSEKIIDGYTFEFWDTAGQERYQAESPQYYRGAKIIILMFDVNNLNTMDELRDYIFLLISQRLYHPEAKFMIIGNKTDLHHDDTGSITKKFQDHPDVKKYGFSGFKPYYISVKENENLDELVADMLMHARSFEIIEQAKELLVDLGEDTTEDDGCGC